MRGKRSTSRPGSTRAAISDPDSRPKRPPRQRRSKSLFDANLEQVDWTDLEIFLHVAEAESVRTGAANAGRAVNTARNHIARMEDRLGELIARRAPDGFSLTRSGKRLLNIAREMRSSRQAATGSGAEFDQRSIRIATTEGLGTYWLTPRVIEFQTASKLEIDLHCDMQRVDVNYDDFDIAVQLEPPEDASTRCFRLGTLHLMPFASDEYLRLAGVPQSVSDWPSHRLIWQKADQVASDLLPYIVGTSDTGDFIRFTTNSSLTHFRAVAAGGGIGILPTYARAISRLVRPIDIGVRLKREILCVVNPARAGSPEVEHALAWLISVFSGETYSWFRDEFVHPSDFEKAATADNVTRLFDGYVDGLDPNGMP